MTAKTKPEIDWSLTTWKGSRLQQHREFLALPFGRKLECVEELADMARAFSQPVAQGQTPHRVSNSSAPDTSRISHP
jgi:hypothetical protein